MEQAPASTLCYREAVPIEAVRPSISAFFSASLSFGVGVQQQVVGRGHIAFLNLLGDIIAAAAASSGKPSGRRGLPGLEGWALALAACRRVEPAPRAAFRPAFTPAARQDPAELESQVAGGIGKTTLPAARGAQSGEIQPAARLLDIVIQQPGGRATLAYQGQTVSLL